jgi:formylglycine-generating enzyme required for sulfatase activity
MRVLTTTLAAALTACDVPDLVLVARDVPEVGADHPATTAFDAGGAVTDAALTAPTPSCPDPTETGCERVRVTGGAFTQGAEDLPTSRPVRADVRVSGFTLDAYEVTVARARRFRDDLPRWLAALPARGEVRVNYPDGSFVTVSTREVDGVEFQSDVEGIGINRLDDPAPTLAAHPVNGVSWTAAQLFCAWDGGRLPTEAEWEYAARAWRADTAAGRSYPWGESAPARRCNLAHWMIAVFTPNGLCAGTDGRASRRVGSLALGQVFGIHDLAGNAAEWTADHFGPYASPCVGRGDVDPRCADPTLPERAVRGGSARTPAAAPQELRGAWRSGRAPARRDNDVGFRCAR